MNRMRARRGDGFTLIEVIVAIGIITIGLLGTLPMLTYSVKSNVASKNRGVALFLADRQVEKIKSWPAYVYLPNQLDSGATGIQGVNLTNQGFGEGGEAGWDWNCGSAAGCTNCCREYNLRINTTDTKFNRTTWIIRNGYPTGNDTSYACEGAGGITFLPGGTSGKNFDEGGIYPSVQSGTPYFGSTALSYMNMSAQLAPSFNHSGRGYEYDKNCPDARRYRGEDFVLVRVEVTWKDLFSEGGKHSVVRNLYVRGH
jgi:prepilin-type N-terminal cleavage/methylation domain-containing protein